jgi:CBS domain-containing protein
MTAKVADVMTPAPLTVRADTGLKEAARVMVDHRVSALPVVDDRGDLIGIISEADFVRRLAGRSDRALSVILERKLDEGAGATVEEAMTRRPVVIDPHATVAEAARLMTKHKVKRLPVVEGGRLIGIVSRADLLGVYARTDSAIAEEIRHDGMVGMLGLDPESVEVTVIDGVVSLRGQLETRAEARMLAGFAERVDGVVKVVDELHFRIDEGALPPR